MLDPISLLNSFGTFALVGLILLVFVESGVLFPFLPGDSLLFTAGLIAANKSEDIQPFASVGTILITLSIASILGSLVGYFLGRKFGIGLFKKDNKILKLEYLEETDRFFEKYGPITLILARYVPIVRTFVPVAAGIAKMNFWKFISFNTIGGVTWVFIVTLSGYFLGNIEFVKNNVDIIFIGIVLVSVLPIVFQIARKLFANRKKS